MSARSCILLLTRGGVTDPLACAGVNHNLHHALREHYAIVVADVQLRGWRRYVNALYALTVAPHRLRRAYYVNLWAFEQMTKQSERVLMHFADQYDVILQLYAVHAPSHSQPSQPYVVYEDCTHRMAEMEYPEWDTFRPAQREQWYRRERQLYQRAGCVFVRSSRAAEYLTDFYRVDPRRVITVGAGVNFSSWPDHPKRSGVPTLLFVGKDFMRKGGHDLLAALALVREQIPDVRLLIVGPKEPIERDGVQFLGRVNDRALLQRLYAEALVFVMPSHFEPWGNVFTEAMAYRLPCVGSSAGGSAEIITDGETGYIVPPHDPGTLADRLLRLLRDPALAQRMGERGYERVTQQFTWSRVVERMRPFLDRLIEFGDRDTNDRST